MSDAGITFGPFETVSEQIVRRVGEMLADGNAVTLSFGGIAPSVTYEPVRLSDGSVTIRVRPQLPNQEGRKR